MLTSNSKYNGIEINTCEATSGGAISAATISTTTTECLRYFLRKPDEIIPIEASIYVTIGSSNITPIHNISVVTVDTYELILNRFSTLVPELSLNEPRKFTVQGIMIK